MGELEAEWLAACTAWPGVVVTRDDFVAYVNDRTDSANRGTDHASALGDETAPSKQEEARGLRTSDLYLACACASGNGAAIQAFERSFFSEVDFALGHGRKAGVPAADEVKQLLRHRLFVAEDGERPKIGQYSGRGDLRAWFRVTLTRLILNLQTRKSPEIPFEEGLLTSLLGGSEPAPSLVHHAYKEEFRQAFATAFGSLSDRERSLLRYAFGEELTVAAIGGLYGVHKATAARWVVAAHKSLTDGVRSILVRQLGIGDDEYASLLRVVRDSLELSLERYLQAPA